ncbi:CU044_2847 family protein [Streptomyces sp. NPDC058251]|uniref:CU044_2847 family protein n=1 Tax=Streptomyces sp. NPDC058251 TaxID=3346404 RepID=UPI0036E199C4
MVVVEQRTGAPPIQIEISEIPDEKADDPSDIYGDKTRGARDRVVRLARPLFSEALDLIGSCAEEVHESFSALPQDRRPQEFEMQFAVQLDAKVGAKIVEATAGAQLQVVLRWKAPDNERPSAE